MPIAAALLLVFVTAACGDDDDDVTTDADADADADADEPSPIVCENDCLYVRAGASGAGDGSSWADAFPVFPDTIERGVTVLVADGEYPGLVLDDPAEGETLIVVAKARG